MSTEEAYLQSYDIHAFDVPLTTVDVVIFAVRQEQLQVLLTRRDNHPCKGSWALPGGFVRVHEDADLAACAGRTLREKTGVVSPYLEQLQTVGNATRDPRGWSVTVVYFALIGAVDAQPADSTTGDTAWRPVDDIPEPLAFDHAEILRAALERLRNKVEYTALPIHLLPETFTLSELQRSFEIVLGRTVDKSAFRRRIREAAIIEPVPGAMRHGSNRPAQLYRSHADPAHYFSRMLEGPRRG